MEALHIGLKENERDGVQRKLYFSDVDLTFLVLKTVSGSGSRLKFSDTDSPGWILDSILVDLIS